MTHLLYIISTFQKTGPINILINVIKELNREKFNPIVLSLSNEKTNSISAKSEIEDLDVNVYTIGLSRIDGFLSGKNRILSFCKQQNIDVIHLIGFRADFIVQGKSFRKYKIISSIFSNIFDDYTMLYGKYKGLIMAHLHVNSLKGKKIVACSEFVKRELNERTNLNFKVIHNGVPRNKFSIPDANTKLIVRNKLHLAPDKKVFIFVGFLIKRKDPITAIKGFINSKMGQEGCLLVLGDGPLMNDCKKAAEGYNSVVFMGNTSETLSYLQAADYYIASSLSEGLPTSVVEALACGLPLILSDIAPHMEILDIIQESKYSFSVEDFMKLSILIDEIITEDYKTLSINSRKAVDVSLNSEIMSIQYQSLYST